MQNSKSWLKKLRNSFSDVNRDPRYVITLIWSTMLFGLLFLQAVHAGWFDSFEKPVFSFFNDLPHWIGPIMYFITQFGSLGGLIAWMLLAWYLLNKRAAITVFVAGNLGWIIAKVIKADVHRGRPQEFIHHVNLFQDKIYSGFGFPSGHSTFSAACATVLYYQVRPRYRKYLILIVVLVGISRMYLGAHFPLDVVGGWALGIACGSIVMLLMGTQAKQLSARTVKKVLNRRGYDIKTANLVTLDARGSRPIFIEDAAGKQYFGKLVGDQEHAADWLFKIYRFFRYKNLQAEEPFLNGRRSIELESFANLWAKKGGVRSPDIVDIVKIGRNWLLLQEKIEATPLSDMKRAKTTTIEDAWRQVSRLHKANMAHRDLRSANLMIDKSGQAWIIDYGFAEVSADSRRRSMDIAELLMSMSLVVGVSRTVDAAVKIVGKDTLKPALRYIHKSVFSGATNQALKQNKELLTELRDTLKNELGIKGDISAPDIDRLNAKKLITIILLTVFAYVIIPQFVEFKDAFGSLDSVRQGWLLPVLAASMFTYVAAGLVYVALASVPLKLGEASLVQLAASFMSKIVPGGIGSTGLNARYLIKSGLDATEASALIFGQNFIGMIMFVVPLGLFLLIDGQSVGSLFTVHIDSKIITAIVAAVCIGVVIGYGKKRLRAKIQEFFARFITQIRDISTSPRELTIAAVASLSITACYVGCLYASIHALHATLSVGAAVLIYATAVIARTAVPTPGGLGPVEVSMSAAMISAGVPSGQSLAIVILYRLATFWLPVPFSVLAYRYVMKKNII